MALSAGDLVANKYRISKRLGQGRPDDIYLAEDQLDQRNVVLKCLPPDNVGKQTDIDRFLAQAHTLTRISDENVLAIYDVVEDEDGNYYLVMEWADQGTVAGLLQQEKQLSVLRSLQLGLIVVQTLDMVHAQNILHRDIKPSNILLVSGQDDIQVKLADFGRSRGITGAESDSYSGSFLYSAPEQLGSKTVDQRADLYALGATMYEMLTGHPPFPYSGKPEELGQVIRSLLTEPPAPPSQFNPDVSPSVDEVILKTLEKTPDQRYSDAQAMGQALQQAIDAQQLWQRRAQIAHDQAVEHESRREWKQAGGYYETVLEVEPDHDQARERLFHVQEQLDWATRYSKGIHAYGQGRWKEAEQILLQVITYNENFVEDDAVDILADTRQQIELARIYIQAVEFEAEERWLEALDIYVRILALEQDYKDAPARLSNADEQQKRQTLYRHALEFIENRAWAEAVETLQELERLDPNYRNSANLLTKARRQNRLHELYTRAIRALDDDEWVSAIEGFTQVLRFDPGYKDAAIKRAIAERQNRLVHLYEQAKAQMQADEWLDAVEMLQEIVEIEPVYRDAALLLEQAIPKQHIADLYREGRELGHEKWEQAIQQLEQVQELQPGYRDVEQLLQEIQRAQRIQALYAQARQFEEKEQQNDAARTYSDIIELDPDHEDAKSGLARVHAIQLEIEALINDARRERTTAIVAAMLVVLVLSYMFFAPLSRMVVAVFLPGATPTEAVITPSISPLVSVTPSAVAPTPTATETMPPTSPPASPTPTLTPTPTGTSIPTEAPSLTPTETPSPIPTNTPESVVTLIATPMPPRLLRPEAGAEVARTNQVTFEWEGRLARAQTYRVVYYSDVSPTTTSPDLTTNSWTALLAADQYGGYYWYVVVIQNGSQVTRSAEQFFWFVPFPQTPSSGSTGSTPSATEPPP